MRRQGPLMRIHTFVPTERKHPTLEEKDLLLRHLEHDLFGDLDSVHDVLEHIGIEDSGLEMDEIRRKANKSLVRVEHVAYVCVALHELSLGGYLPGESFSLKKTFSLVNRIIEKRDKKAVVEGYNGEDIKVHNVESALYLQLFSMATNAVKSYGQASPRGVALGAEELALTAEQRPALGPFAERYAQGTPFVRAYVQDHGSGIDGDISRIFEAGVSGCGSSGIGLALTDAVCAALHGFLTVETEVGTGSTFSLYFPKEKGK